MAVSISLQSLGLIILAAVLLQTIAVAISFIYFNKVLNTMQQSFSRSSVSCLIDAEQQLEKKNDPCWQVTQQLHYHIEKTMADKLQKEMRNKLTGGPILSPGGPALSPRGPILSPGGPALSPGVPLSKVAAHVTAVSASKSTTAESSWSSSSRGFLGERIRAWEGHRGPSFLQNMELRGGDLLVPTAGLYYIYAQTYFKIPSTGDGEAETKEEAGEEEGATLVQYIYKKMSSYTGPILLMKSSRSACWPRGQEPGLFSLHQAGTAFLQPADRLFVTVSNASALEPDGRATYFGAFLVG